KPDLQPLTGGHRRRREPHRSLAPGTFCRRQGHRRLPQPALPTERVWSMNGGDLLRGVELMHREKNISREVIFASIEKAVRLAILKRYDDEEGIDVVIDRQSGVITARKGEAVLAPEELGRIAAQSAKQLMIQNFREEES